MNEMLNKSKEVKKFGRGTGEEYIFLLLFLAMVISYDSLNMRIHHSI